MNLTVGGVGSVRFSVRFALGTVHVMVRFVRFAAAIYGACSQSHAARNWSVNQVVDFIQSQMQARDR